MRNPSFAPEHTFTAEGVTLSLMSEYPAEWHVRHEPFPYLYLHTHSWYELFFAASGTVEIHFENGVRVLSAGEALIVSPRVLHYMAPAVGSEWRAFSFSVKPTGERTETSERLLHFLRFDGTLPLRAGETCDHLSRLLCAALASHEWAIAGCHLYALLLSAASEGGEAADALLREGDMGRVYRIEQFCASFLHTSITLSDLAAEMHLSERHLSRIILKQYGKSFRAYLASLRVEAAASMLAEGNSVGETAAAVGYASIGAFSNVFRKSYGVSPGTYRRMHMKK